jgi:DIE2/ALG10 family
MSDPQLLELGCFTIRLLRKLHSLVLPIVLLELTTNILLEDYVIAARQAVLALLNRFNVALPILWTYIPLLGAFALFLLWNGGITLGECLSYKN